MTTNKTTGSLDPNNWPAKKPGSISVTANVGGHNAIIFILTQDLAAGYRDLLGWLRDNPGYYIHSLSAQGAQLNTQTQLMPQAAMGFAITAICERRRRGFWTWLRSTKNPII